MLIIYLAVLGLAMYYVVKLLGPEMSKPVPTKIVSETELPVIPKTIGTENRTEKLETLMAEKNRNIALLQKELKMFQAQVRDFDKIKSVLEEEIQRLREQNRIFRSELGLPAQQTKETSVK